MHASLLILAASPAASTDVLSSMLQGFNNVDDYPPARQGGVADYPPMELQLFTEEQATAWGARCLDGSPSGYYYREGAEKDSFAIFLDGGGLCTSGKDCKNRANTSLGSSKFWSSTSQDYSNILSADPSYNPFANWTHVRVPYGSGDVYIGSQKKPNLYGLYFSGHNTMEAIVSDLKNRSGFGSAKRVLLSGSSAGGIGTFQNADWLGEQLSPDTVYRASPQAGAYFSNDFIKLFPQYASDILNGTLVNSTSIMADYLVTFYGGTIGKEAVHLDKSCMEAKPLIEKHTCWSAAEHYPYIKTPLFVAQNRFDKNQAGAVMGINWWKYPEGDKHDAEVAAYKRYFGERTVGGIAAEVMNGGKKQTDGLFMPSCWAHGENLCMLRNSSIVKGVTYREALDDWFAGRGKVSHLLVDDCNTVQGTLDPCNPSCACHEP